MEPKFKEGTSQRSLLRNRIKALYISKALIAGESDVDQYTKDELTAALQPVTSIICKCEKAQKKFDEGSSHYVRFEKMIKAMLISRSFITAEIRKRG